MPPKPRTFPTVIPYLNCSMSWAVTSCSGPPTRSQLRTSDLAGACSRVTCSFIAWRNWRTKLLWCPKTHGWYSFATHTRMVCASIGMNSMPEWESGPIAMGRMWILKYPTIYVQNKYECNSWQWNENWYNI